MITHGWHLSDEEIAERYRAVSRQRRYDLGPAHPLIIQLLDRLSRVHGEETTAAEVIDLGCGTGVLAESLATRFPHWRVRGMDPGFPPDADPREISDRVSIRHGTAYDIDAVDGSQDLIIMSEVVEHLNRPDAALAEVRRVLKPGGHAIIAMPNADAFVGWKLWAKLLPFQAAYSRLLPAEHPKRTWQPIDTLYEYQEILELFENNALPIIDTESGQFIPPLLYGAPILGRLYRRFRMDNLFKRILPARMGYRFVFAARKSTA